MHLLFHPMGDFECINEVDDILFFGHNAQQLCGVDMCSIETHVVQKCTFAHERVKCFLLLVVYMYVLFTTVMSVGVTVEPHSCICPSQSYTCRADSILGMTWNSSMLTETVVYSTVTPSEKIIDRDGVLVQFSDVRVGQRAANFTSHLFITDIHTVNGSTFTCEASSLQSDGSDMITICVTGKIIILILYLYHLSSLPV